MRVLLIVHGYPPAAAGGTEVYTRALARALARSGHEVTVLTRDADPCRPEYAVVRRAEGSVSVVGINNTFQACTSFEDSYINPALLRTAAQEVERAAPDVAHIQHLTCLSTGLPAAAAALGIPVVMTLNDYWMICHRGQLFDLNRQRCDGPLAGGCSACLPPAALASPRAFRAGRLALASRIPGAASIASAAAGTVARFAPAAATREATLRRSKRMQETASQVDLFLAPSAELEARFLQFGLPRARLLRCSQGIDLAPFAHICRARSEVLRIGYAGGIIPSKAPHLLLEAVAALGSNRVAVDIIGQAASFHGDDGYAEEVKPLLAHPSVRRTGAVSPERMPEVLAALDVLVVPSTWIENAPFVIREAFAAKVPVIASNLGGMAEMVGHDEDGLLFEPGSPDALRAALSRVLTEPGLLDRLREGIRQPMSIEEDAAGLTALYESLPRRHSRAVPAAAGMQRSTSVAAVVLNYRTPEQTWLAVRSLQTSQTVPDPVVVVDNGSSDKSADWLREHAAGVQVLATGENLGYSGGCNAGLRRIREAGAEFALLVNSDVVLRPDALGTLLDAARRFPDAGVLAPVLLSREEPDWIASAGISFDRVSGRMRHRGAGLRLSHLQPSGPHAVDAVSGAVMLIRTDVLAQIGLLEERFFFSFEDIEFCLRTRHEGFSIMCVPDAIAYHEGGRSIGRRSTRRVYFATRNHLYLADRAGRGTPFTRLARAGLVIGLNAAYALTSREVPVVGGLAAVARGAWHHARGRYGSD